MFKKLIFRCADSIKRRLVPVRLALSNRGIHANTVLSGLYAHFKGENKGKFYFYDSVKYTRKNNGDELPVPPRGWRMGYETGNDEAFVAWGKKTACSIRSIMAERNITLDSESAVLDFGCASGRVLRHFAKEAENCEFWGVDRDERVIRWADENLSPPFKFLTCTAYPHLPFSDGKFSFIYGISVFTHIEHLQEMWLMEINRILKKGGYAIFTICDEHSLKYHLEKKRKVSYLPRGLTLREIEKHDITVISYSDTAHTFLKNDWIKKKWGKYFEVVDIIPHAETYQSAVILKKS